ncbi:MAG: L-lactate dehydrogenase [Phototrophicales bacterium]|nr:MAG: L-lactate dehydrogenase [Phototrophicales bacterium]
MKVGVVGSGLVGATAAYAMVMRGVGREVILCDKFAARALAEADDIFHAVPFAEPVDVRVGDYPDLEGAKAVIIAAGVNQQPGETRLQLLERNAAVFREIVPEILRFAPDAVLVVATNPVDIMTHLTARIAADAGGDPSRVLGSGTTLDTARFRALLSRHLGVDSRHVHAYVVGEHGDSEVLTWSLVTVGGVPLADFLRHRSIAIDAAVRAEIDDRVRYAAYRIIEGKRATYYGIGSALAQIVNVILRDQRAILTVCAPEHEVEGVKDVTVALPRLVGGTGVIDTLAPTLSEQEHEALGRSAAVVRAAIDGLGI